MFCTIIIRARTNRFTGEVKGLKLMFNTIFSQNSWLCFGKTLQNPRYSSGKYYALTCWKLVWIFCSPSVFLFVHIVLSFVRPSFCKRFTFIYRFFSSELSDQYQPSNSSLFKWTVIPFCKGICSDIMKTKWHRSKTFFFRKTKPISTKFGTKHP